MSYRCILLRGLCSPDHLAPGIRAILSTPLGARMCDERDGPLYSAFEDVGRDRDLDSLFENEHLDCVRVGVLDDDPVQLSRGVLEHGYSARRDVVVMRPRDSRAGSPDRVVFTLVMPGLGLQVAVVPDAGAVVRADHLHTEPDPLASRPVDRRLCILDSHREAVELTGAGEVHSDRCRM